jgi:hypothetical protein
MVNSSDPIIQSEPSRSKKYSSSTSAREGMSEVIIEGKVWVAAKKSKKRKGEQNRREMRGWKKGKGREGERDKERRSKKERVFTGDDRDTSLKKRERKKEKTTAVSFLNKKNQRKTSEGEKERERKKKQSERTDLISCRDDFASDASDGPRVLQFAPEVTASDHQRVDHRSDLANVLDGLARLNLGHDTHILTEKRKKKRRTRRGREREEERGSKNENVIAR